MDVPLLLVHGTADDTVAWSESVELYNALRFLGKNVVFLSYQGEGHNLQKYKNQKDLCLRLRQFFDGHLKGKPLPGWWIDGVPFLKRGFRNEEESTKQPLNE